ncbi:uncharacterized protein Z520_10740 [Fonsecaea multimorphosa CBS 102226]|uniref:Uncharacterized protein n=1 Tax=Fonsecaea multimorphosa CBS 102226 TaxID=1442371 RepID=A0A0D2JK02_9EURO|nr:uncharacterized protein Z520_10740 [Fonsecaea multimorphosa CBS 102226]KIX93562.1 hypothetical protein Z520_10740 [Fonsecaea multimorphosa CBS 102226]
MFIEGLREYNRLYNSHLEAFRNENISEMTEDSIRQHQMSNPPMMLAARLQIKSRTTRIDVDCWTFGGSAFPYRESPPNALCFL